MPMKLKPSPPLKKPYLAYIKIGNKGKKLFFKRGAQRFKTKRDALMAAKKKISEIAKLSNEDKRKVLKGARKITAGTAKLVPRK